MKNNTTLLERMENVLSRNTRTPGITASKIAKQVGTNRENVRRRIYELRNDFGLPIFTNKRNSKTYYRLAA